MSPQVVVTFSDFKKMEQIRSILLEKLDKCVHVGAPRFYHSPKCLSEARYLALVDLIRADDSVDRVVICVLFCRERACVSAVENALLKVSEISGVLMQSLGPPLLVREVETKEWTSEEENGGLPVRVPHIPTVTVSSHVSVSYRFKD